MTGLRKRGDSYIVVLNLPSVKDETGIMKRRQKFITIARAPEMEDKDYKAHAKAEQIRLLASIQTDTFVDPSKITVAQYLNDWHRDKVVGVKRDETARVYKQMIKHVEAAPLGSMRLQKLRAMHLEAFYKTVKLAPASVNVLHAVIGKALKTAVRDHLLLTNHARTVEDRPRPSKDPSIGARQHCWTAADARLFLAETATAGPRDAAFYALALDSGAREMELVGLRWPDFDLDAGVLTIAEQLKKKKKGTHLAPEWAPTKNGYPRTVTLGPETVALLKTHRAHQRELMMKNRTTYVDHQLAFAKEPGDMQRPDAKLGQPCLNLFGSRYRKLRTAAKVKAIKFHGTRHTSITLALGAGVPVHIVSNRVGHKDVTTTLKTYAHAMPDMQADAATRLAAVLHGG